MKRLITMIAITFLSGSVILPSHAAKPEWAGKGHEKQAARSDNRSDKITTEHQKDLSDKTKKLKKTSKVKMLSPEERNTIRDYYRFEDKQYIQKHKELPKGLQKKLARGGELPPGWQRKLEAGNVLDSQLRASGESIPDALRKRLPAAVDATEIIRINDKVVRVIRGEGTVVDVVDLADIITTKY